MSEWQCQKTESYSWRKHLYETSLTNVDAVFRIHKGGRVFVFKDNETKPKKKPRLYFKFSKENDDEIFFVEYDESNRKREFKKPNEFSQVDFQLNEVGYVGGTEDEHVFGICMVDQTNFKLRKFCHEHEIDHVDPDETRFIFVFRCENEKQSDKEYTIHYFLDRDGGYLDGDVQIYCLLKKRSF